MADLFDDIDVAAAPEAPGARGEQVLADVGAVEVPRSDHSVASGPSEFVVKCRGLPWQVQLEDVGSFFSGCDLIPGSLLFTFNSRGDCFALFATAEGHHKALAKDRQSMGSRYIEVERSDLAEYTRARDGKSVCAVARVLRPSRVVLQKRHSLTVWNAASSRPGGSPLSS